LTAPEVELQLNPHSVLCLPVGSYEQHGPHLPLHTDTVIAEGFAARLVERHGQRYGMWTLPALPFGLSLEHAWSPGTISLRLRLFADLLDVVVGEVVRATPARRLLIINGHGGNRGILEAAMYELGRAHGIGICAVHPISLSSVKVETPVPEVHAGVRETSVMLAMDPGHVYLDRLPQAFLPDESQYYEVSRAIINRGTTWPWTSNGPGLSTLGVTGGDPRSASAELGESIIASALDACDDVLERL
jgi:creatinine amidohydrolase